MPGDCQKPIVTAFLVVTSCSLSIFEVLKNRSIKSKAIPPTINTIAIGTGFSSTASIIGGMQQGLSMRMAAEFSFFLAVPTMLAVTCYSIFLKDWEYNGIEQKGFQMIMESNNLLLFIIGNIVAFIVAIIAIKFFINVLKKYGFKMWGWYRIVLGVVFILYYSFIK